MHSKNWLLVFHFIGKHLKHPNSIVVREEGKGSAVWYSKKKI